jgi:PPE-repeat protein
VDWDSVAEPLQLRLAAAAWRRAAASIALQAETLAREMETGMLEAWDGPEALRLLAAVLRVTSEDGLHGALPA